MANDGNPSGLGEVEVTHDVCIVGAGPAGLSAALILGRCRRKVVVFDSGKPRNAASRGLHGFITRDGAHPMQLRHLAREELARYPTVEVRDQTVLHVARAGFGFETHLEGGERVRSRILLLATGRDDELPPRPGFFELFGKGVYHCPICDGWEHRDQPLAVYGRGEPAFDVAIDLLTWSKDVTWCTDAEGRIGAEHRRRASANGIVLREEEIERLMPGDDGFLAGILFADGSRIACRALFFVTDTPQKSALPEKLGCRFGPSGGVECDDHAATDVPGLFVAGNVRCGVHLAITAAAEGAEAAIAINDALCCADAK
jgi:thioredoxin reductase